MAIVEVHLSKMGESVTEAKILRWLKKPGDEVEADESLLEVATDKVDTEIPSTHSGILKEILANEGDVAQIGQVIAILEGEEAEEPAAHAPVSAAQSRPSALAAAPIASKPKPFGGIGRTVRFYSPLVRAIAQRESVLPAELDTIQGTGAQSRVTKEDLLRYIEQRKSGAIARKAEAPSVPAIIGVGDEIIEMDRMRQMIAERMVESKRIAPHATSFVEADVTALALWREQIKEPFQRATGEALTYMPLFIEAIAKAIADFPMINAQVEGVKIIKKKDINIGMAVSLPNGNLIVPTIRNADKLTLPELAKKVNDLAHRARQNKLKPDDLAGGTYTVSNIGTFGNLMGTPIILQPQVAIMALGKIEKVPAVIDTPEGGEAIAIRRRIILSHAYDHRVVDGALGGMVARRVADYLENFDKNRKI